MITRNIVTAIVLLAGVVLPHGAAAQERLCDASVENCRVPLLFLINNEQIGIDVGVWFFKDDRYVTALVKAKNRGVPIRILMDPRANTTYPANATALTTLAAAGIPMRKRIAGDILHWKLMIFNGQAVVEWSGANFSPVAFVPIIPYHNYEDEVIYFSRALIASFMTKFDDIWTNTTDYADYANVTPPLVAIYDKVTLDARLNFPPTSSYQNRLVPLIDNEPAGGLIDVDMYRITMARPVDALIRAAARGVRQRLYLEPNEYANTARPGNKVQMDRLVAAARTYPGTIEIRMRAHAGLNHQKTVWLHAQHIVVFGTSNWSDASDDNQLEANIFTNVTVADGLNDLLFAELNAIFERKFYNEAPDGSIETIAWRTPSLPRPVVSANCTDRAATNYGQSLPCYYPPPPPPPDPSATTVVIWAANVAATELHGNWQRTTDQTAAGTAALANPNAAQAKISSALATPSNFFETTFAANAGTAYHLWVRLRAQDDGFGSDSVHMQFSDSVTSSGAATMRINSTSSAQMILQNGATDTGVHSWGWADNGWNGPGADIYFANTGTHTLRVQQREDGAIVDQIVLSPTTYVTAAPGPRDNDTTILSNTEGETARQLPAPWQTGDVGPVGLAGSASESGGTFTITGAGADVWGTTDAFRYVYQPLPGDGTIVVRVATAQNVNVWTKAGVMIRQTLTANSPHASMFITPGKGLAFQRRTTGGATSLNTNVTGTAPRWVKLARVDQVVEASVSIDGATWATVGQETIALFRSGLRRAGDHQSRRENARLRDDRSRDRERAAWAA